MSEFNEVRPELSSWRAVQLRLTTYTLPTARPLVPRGWWESLTAESSEKVQEQPKLGKYHEEGRFLGGVLALDVKLNRVSWELSGILELEKDIDFGVLGSFVSARDSFLEKVVSWLDTSPPIQRLAFGAHLILPVENGVAAYRTLASYLPFSLDPEKDRDLQFRINRTCRSSVVDVAINRLRTWSVTLFRLGGLVVGQEPQVTHEQFACSLELDINTSADSRDELDRGKLQPLARELVAMGTEVAAKGEGA